MKKFMGFFIAGLVLQFVLVQLSFASEGDLEFALNQLIDAVKVGKFAVIIVAIIGLIRTPFVMKLLAPLLQKIGFSFLIKKEIDLGSLLSLPTVGGDKVDPVLVGDGVLLSPIDPNYVSVPKPELKGSVLPIATVLTGVAASVLSSIASGQKPAGAIVEGLVSSGVAMGLFDLLIKPIKNIIKK